MYGRLGAISLVFLGGVVPGNQKVPPTPFCEALGPEIQLGSYHSPKPNTIATNLTLLLLEQSVSLPIPPSHHGW